MFRCYGNVFLLSLPFFTETPQKQQTVKYLLLLIYSRPMNHLHRCASFPFAQTFTMKVSEGKSELGLWQGNGGGGRSLVDANISIAF